MASKRPPIVLTRHSVDRASLRMMDKFNARPRPRLGFFSWLVREAQRALCYSRHAQADTLSWKSVQAIIRISSSGIRHNASPLRTRVPHRGSKRFCGCLLSISRSKQSNYGGRSVGKWR